jgi:hypothetical protein
LGSSSEFINFFVIVIHTILHAVGNSFHFLKVFVSHFSVLIHGVVGTDSPVSLEASGRSIHGQVEACWIAVPAIKAVGGMALAFLDGLSTDTGDLCSFSRRDLSGSAAHAVSHFHELGNIRGAKSGGFAERGAIA